MRSLPQKPFRVGIQASHSVDGTSWTDLARTAEANGFDVLTMPDHFTEQFAPIPALAAAAAATSSLRIGALVFDNDYKHPVVLAKELATMDVLSSGRVEIGIGAGWMITDYEQAGIPYDPPGVRVDRFIEGVRVIQGCMADGPFSFSGKHYTITDYNGLPKPVQGPCPPILIGGGGKRVLTFAAQNADIVGINPNLKSGAIDGETIGHMSAESVDEKVGIVADAAGERLDHIEMNIRAFIVNVTEDRDAAVDALAGFFNAPREMVDSTPFGAIGPPSAIVEQLLAQRERWGFSYIIVGGDDVDSFAPVVAQLRGK
jgi:probable F420-dependent oxidoreductase